MAGGTPAVTGPGRIDIVGPAAVTAFHGPESHKAPDSGYRPSIASPDQG